MRGSKGGASNPRKWNSASRQTNSGKQAAAERIAQGKAVQGRHAPPRVITVKGSSVSSTKQLTVGMMKELVRCGTPKNMMLLTAAVLLAPTHPAVPRRGFLPPTSNNADSKPSPQNDLPAPWSLSKGAH